MSAIAVAREAFARAKHDLSTDVPVPGMRFPLAIRYRIFYRSPMWIVIATDSAHHGGGPEPLTLYSPSVARYGLVIFPVVNPRRAVFIEHYDRRAHRPAYSVRRGILFTRALDREEFAFVRFPRIPSFAELLTSEARIVDALDRVPTATTRAAVESLIGGRLS